VNKKGRVLGVLTIIGLVFGAAYWWQISGKNAAAEAALTLYGNVDIREVRLAFNGSEHVSEILVDEGDRVQPGQLLARLHTVRLEATRDRVRAELVVAQAKAHAAQLAYQRIKSMEQRKLASAEQADEAEGNSRATAASVVAAEAALAETEQVLKDAEMFAPVGGIVRERILETGDFATPQTPVLTLALIDPVWVRTYLPESYLGQIKPGDQASITTDSFPGKAYPGWVGFISPTAEFTPKNVETSELRTRLVYQARIFACNPESELRLGMPATVTIPLGQARPAAGQPEQHCAQSASVHK